MTLAFIVIGTELPDATDSLAVLPPGAVGMAAATPTEEDPSGLAFRSTTSSSRTCPERQTP